MRTIFINDFGRLRSGWRVILFIVASIAVFYIFGAFLLVVYALVSAVAPMPPTLSRFTADAIYRVNLVTSALVAGYLCARFLEGLPWKSLGLALHKGWLRDLVMGSAIGFVSLAFAVGIAALGGGLHFSFGEVPILPIVRAMVVWAGFLFVAALAEEAMFRGYGLQTLTRANLAWLGILLTSVPFGLAHLQNPNAVAGPTLINTVIAGVWFAAAYLRKRSLGVVLGTHWALNRALGWFFGLPVSGLNLTSNSLLKATDQGPAWLTGGSYGIEGGIAGTVALVLSTALIWWAPWIKATPEMKQLTSQENPVVREPVVSIRPE
jgi:membrane protease YdiL (CAAX protease family)